MESSLIPPGKVIHILLYATRAPSGPYQILPEGFPEIGLDWVDLRRKDTGGPGSVNGIAELWKKDHVERVS